MLFGLVIGPFVWLIIMAVFLIVEILTLGLTTIWFAAGALGAFIVALLGGSLWLQIAVFIVISIVLLVFTKPVADRLLNSRVVKTNVDSLPGQRVRVTETINNIQETGQVMMNGLEWMARAENDDEIIEKDTIVVVKQVTGVKVIVEKEK
ncbi:MAG: NfeD family protein [Lachnospiraceae bacterium]